MAHTQLNERLTMDAGLIAFATYFFQLAQKRKIYLCFRKLRRIFTFQCIK